MSEISITKEEALMRIDTLRMAYICDPQECGKKDGYDKNHIFCRECDDTYEALALATEALEKQMPKKPKAEKNTFAESFEENIEYYCQSCGCYLTSEYECEFTEFCDNCGQAIDWS